MAYRKTLLLVGNDARVREFVREFMAVGAIVEEAADDHAALTALTSAATLPDAIVFIVPVYWESVGGFVTTLRQDPRLKEMPVVYLGDFIEANDQVVLKSRGVHTLTLGPVPANEAVRYVMRIVEGGSSPDLDIMHPRVS